MSSTSKKKHICNHCVELEASLQKKMGELTQAQFKIAKIESEINNLRSEVIKREENIKDMGILVERNLKARIDLIKDQETLQKKLEQITQYVIDISKTSVDIGIYFAGTRERMNIILDPQGKLVTGEKNE